MHEFSSVQDALAKLKALHPRPKKVKITLGKMRGSNKGFTEMLAEQVRDSDLSGIQIEVVQTPVEVKCKCGFSGSVKVMGHIHFVRCPLCSDIADITAGNELIVQPLE